MADRKPPSVTYALTRALRAVKTGPEHAPTVALAKRYAAAIDEDADLAHAWESALERGHVVS